MDIRADDSEANGPADFERCRRVTGVLGAEVAVIGFGVFRTDGPGVFSLTEEIGVFGACESVVADVLEYETEPARLARGVATTGLDFSTVAGLEGFGRDKGGFGVDSLDEVDVMEVPDLFGFILAVRPLAGTAALLGADAKA